MSDLILAQWAEREGDSTIVPFEYKLHSEYLIHSDGVWFQ